MEFSARSNDLTTTSEPFQDKGSPRRTLTSDRVEGFVIACDGEHAVISATAETLQQTSQDYWAAGQMISIRVGESRLVGLIYEIEVPNKIWDTSKKNTIHIHVELIGEVRPDADGTPQFSGGIGSYPHMGAIAHRIRATDLEAVYTTSDSRAVRIGTLTQDARVPALIDIDKLLARHFAIVGTTGVGKSSAVSLLLHRIIAERSDMRILILDPHNEFSSAFEGSAITVDADTLNLPFWVFRFEELLDVIYRGRPPIGEEADALRDMIPVAKEQFRKSHGDAASYSVIKRDTASPVTADTPVPYRMADLLDMIKERIGQLEGKELRPHLKALRTRLESLISDPRFRFMFGAKTIGDTLQATLSHVFRIPQDDKPICIFEMSNLPSEVVNSVVSVMCRMAFDLALSSDGVIKTLVVCEEAHRYIPADRQAGFWPTRQAIARIAKEGRKYGVYLGVVTQRPGELDATILSQCNTVFAMRLGNESDQQIIRKSIAGAAKSTISFLPSIANRECIAFGEAFRTPMRMTFGTLGLAELPGTHMQERQAMATDVGLAPTLSTIIQRMRHEKPSAEAPTKMGHHQPHSQSASDEEPRSADPAGDEARPGHDEMREAFAAALFAGPEPVQPLAQQAEGIAPGRQAAEPAPHAPPAKDRTRQTEDDTQVRNERGTAPDSNAKSPANDIVRSFRLGMR